MRSRRLNLKRAKVIGLLCGTVIWLAIEVAGCHSPVAPRVRNITGVVRYPGGEPVNTAKVLMGIGLTSTFSDSVGRYAIAAPADSDSVTLNARDGYDGRPYAFTHFGRVRIAVGRYGAVTDIILDQIGPI